MNIFERQILFKICFILHHFLCDRSIESGLASNLREAFLLALDP